MVSIVRPQGMPDEDGDNEDVNVDEPHPPRKKSNASKPPAPERKWEKNDINCTPLPPFNHPVPDCIRSPFEYFQDMFTVSLLQDIVFQTNLYARQKDVNTAFHIDKHELMVFIGIALYMGVVQLPAIEDYWSTCTRVPQVADVMSSKRFRLIRSQLHFNNNDNIHDSTDRFYKIRPIISSLTRQFLQVKATPTQSVDEVMVAYKGTRAGNLRQYIQSKPDRWGYKLFCRASIDGFLHDILMYQGEPTFTSHHMKLTKAESELLVSTKTVIVLAKTLKNPSQSAIYADNYFTSMDLVEYLKEKLGCRYVGTARVNRIGRAPLLPTKEMERKGVSRGEYDYCSTNGVLAMRWKDNKSVTILSSDAGVHPVQSVKRYDQNAKKKIDVPCPNVIKEYNGKMGGIDKSDMLTHLYKTPMRARRWYMRLFGYALDLCVCNAWILYKRDCIALKEMPMPLKNFRLDISRFARCQNSVVAKVTRLSSKGPMPVPQRGQRSPLPSLQLQYDLSKGHMPTFVPTRQTCKRCCTKNGIHRSRWMCEVCKVALCLSDTRNCFKPFHTAPENVAQAPSA